MATVDWLAKVFYEAAHLSAHQRGMTSPDDLHWEELTDDARGVYIDGLTGALTALRDPALLKLREGEPIFVLRAQDQVAPEIIEDWRVAAIEAGMPQDGPKNTRAGAKRDAFVSWQEAHPDLVKVPD